VAGLGRTVAPSCTERIPLVGADGWEGVRNRSAELARAAGIDERLVRRLVGRYGAEAPALLDVLGDDPDLARPLPGTDHHLGVEVHWAVSHEGALHLNDVLTRRTRVSIEATDRGVAAAPVAARIMAPVLGWTDADVAREVENYRARVAAEIDSQGAADDRTADARRLGAPDVRAALDAP
jgi:glycerol-3-phosphate dehydrogenase